ncbi:MAG: HIRAN domain-containing protein [Acidobacteriota bacterium]
MERREFLTTIPSLAWLWAGKLPIPTPPEPVRRTLIQSSPVAGFQFYEGPKVSPNIAPGDRLALVREPGNPHDRLAVAVHWQSRKLGYLPRDVNGLPSSLLDQGRTVYATVTARRESHDPWRRLEIEVWLEG